MMRTIIGIAGFVLGVALALLLLFLNPVVLTYPRAVMPVGSTTSLSWDTAASAGMPLSPLGLLGVRDGRGHFADPGIRYARVEIAALPDTDASGAAPALVVRLAGLAEGNSLLGARLGTVTQTNIVWPGRGSLFLAGSENLWAPLRAGFWSALRGKGFRPAGDGYVLAPLPGIPGGTPSVAGASGAYATVRGAYRESFTPDGARPGDFAVRRTLEFATE
jgi:hypothetical protein